MAKAALQEINFESPIKDLAVEEVEKVNLAGRPAWKVTLGFFRQKTFSTSGIGLLGSPVSSPAIENRAYRAIYIDSDNGEFLKMEIRDVR